MPTLTATAVLSGPGSLVASVPYLVGFAPENSIVGIWLKGTSILVTQRVDIEAVVSPEIFYGPLLDKGPTEVVLISYGEVDRSTFVEFAETIGNAFGDQFGVRDVLWVKGDRWGSYLCKDPGCCPPEGKEIDISLAAEFVGAEVAPLESREVLAAECRPQGKRNTRQLPAKDKLEAYRSQSIAAFNTTVLRSDIYDSNVGIMRELGRSLHDIRVRDTVLWDITNADRDTLGRFYELMRSVCQASTPEQAAPACTVAAIAAWLKGDGARANVALEYAYEADPEYSLMKLVRISLDSGIHPNAWREAIAKTPRDECRYGVGR